jgi:hypothetical protein
VAKEGLESAALIGSDLIEGDDLKSSLRKRASRGAKNLIKKTVDKTVPPEVRGYNRLGKPRRMDLRARLSKRKNQSGSGRIRNKKYKKKRSRQVGYGKKKKAIKGAEEGKVKVKVKVKNPIISV